jgi:hypothetical protein
MPILKKRNIKKKKASSIHKKMDAHRSGDGVSKRPKVEEQLINESPSFWRDISTNYFRNVDLSELRPF